MKDLIKYSLGRSPGSLSCKIVKNDFYEKGNPVTLLQQIAEFFKPRFKLAQVFLHYQNNEAFGFNNQVF